MKPLDFLEPEAIIMDLEATTTAEAIIGSLRTAN
jgi:hypothetical protein